MSEQQRQRERTPAHWPPDRELRVGRVVLAGLALAVATALTAVAMWYLSIGLRESIEAGDPPPPALLEALAPHEPPTPRLQVQPADDLHALRAEERALLESYAWVDEASGIARVPIDRAMELLLENRPDGRAFEGTGAGAAPMPATSEPTDTDSPPAPISEESEDG